MDDSGFRKITFEEALDERGQFVFTGEGDSMLPMLRGKRDLLVIVKRPLDENGKPIRLKKYDVVFYKRGGKYITHRILRVLPTGEKRPRRMTRQGLKTVTGDYVIAGDHNAFREYDVKEEQILYPGRTGDLDERLAVSDLRPCVVRLLPHPGGGAAGEGEAAGLAAEAVNFGYG